jgi:hypothetical protein
MVKIGQVLTDELGFVGDKGKKDIEKNDKPRDKQRKTENTLCKKKAVFC